MNGNYVTTSEYATLCLQRIVIGEAAIYGLLLARI